MVSLSLVRARQREPQHEDLYKELEERIASVEGDVTRRLENLREFPMTNELILYPVSDESAELTAKFEKLSTVEVAPAAAADKPTEEMIQDFERLLSVAAAEAAAPKAEALKAEAPKPESSKKSKKAAKEASKDAAAKEAAAELAAAAAKETAAKELAAKETAAKETAAAEAAAKQAAAREVAEAAAAAAREEERLSAIEAAAAADALAAEEKKRNEFAIQSGISQRIDEYKGKDTSSTAKLAAMKDEIDYFVALVTSHSETPERSATLEKVLAAQASFTEALAAAVVAEEAKKAAESKLTKKERAALNKQRQAEQAPKVVVEEAPKKPAAEKPKAKKVEKKSPKQKPDIDEDALLAKAMEDAAAEAAAAPKESPKSRKPTAASAVAEPKSARTAESKATDDFCDYSIATVDAQLSKLIPFLTVADYSAEKQQAIGCLAVMMAHVSRYNPSAEEPCSAVGSSCKAVKAAYDISIAADFKAAVDAALDQQRKELKLAAAPESAGAPGSLHDYISRHLQWDIGVLAKIYGDLLLGTAVLKISSEQPLAPFSDAKDKEDANQWQNTFFHSPQGISEHFGREDL